MNLKKILFLLLVFPHLSFAGTHCRIPQKAPKDHLSSQKQNTSFSYRGTRYRVDFQYQKIKGHRSTPREIVPMSPTGNDLLIAWGDMGIVEYSQKYQQMVNFIPIQELTNPRASGEVLSLLKEDHRYQAIIFNDETLRYEKVDFRVSPLEIESTQECQTLTHH